MTTDKNLMDIDTNSNTNIDTNSTEIDKDLKKRIDSFFSDPQIERVIDPEERNAIIDSFIKQTQETDGNINDDILLNTVRNTYKTMLGRQPDIQGLDHYFNMLKSKAITEQQLIEIFKNSNEYKKKQLTIGTIKTDTSKLSTEKDDDISDNTILNTIRRTYKSILERPPDPEGLNHYFNMLKSKAITEQQLIEIFKNSDEYKKNQALKRSPQRNPIEIEINNFVNSESKKIMYCMMGTNRLYEIKPYIETVLPYIDGFIFIDGGSQDGTIEYLKSIIDPKIEIYEYEWKDDFSNQRNNYLNKLKKRNYNDWVLTSDSDEHFPIETLTKLRTLIDKSTDENNIQLYNGVSFQCESIITEYRDISKIVSRNIDRYWKPLFFKYYPDLYYKGEPHETLTGHFIEWKMTNLLYQHKRSQRKIYERAVENFFISNSNRKSQKWVEFKVLCAQNNLLSFSDFFYLYEKGELPKSIEEWIINHKDDNENEGDSEVREMYKLYYEILHPNKILPNQEEHKINIETQPLTSKPKSIVPSFIEPIDNIKQPTENIKQPTENIEHPIENITPKVSPLYRVTKEVTSKMIPSNKESIEESKENKKESVELINFWFEIDNKCEHCNTRNDLIPCHINNIKTLTLCLNCWQTLTSIIPNISKAKQSIKNIIDNSKLE